MRQHPRAPAITRAMRRAALLLGMHPTTGATEEVAGFTCIDAGLGVSPANVALPEPTVRSSLRSLREVADWFAQRALNFRVDIPGDSGSELLAASMTLGLEFWERQPLMLLDPIPQLPPITRLEVRIVESNDDIATFCALDDSDEADRPLIAAIVAAASRDSDIRLLVASHREEPVARIAILLHGQLATLHSLYVHPARRRQGLGADLTAAALAIAAERGATAAALASTLSAAGIYRRLGFETIRDTIVMGTRVPLF